MKNKKLYTLTAMAGLTLGSLGVATVASAERDTQPETTVETSVEEAETSDAGFVRIQDAEGEAPDAGTEQDGEGRNHRRGGCNVDAAAEAIGIEADDLKAQLEAGATIAEVAEANGVAVDTVIDAMVDAKAERVADKVEAGRLTQEEADEKLADLEDRITDRVNGESEDAEDA